MTAQQLSEAELIKLSNFTRNFCGISFSKQKYNALERRALKRMSELEIPSFSDYFEILRDVHKNKEELYSYINAITIQETYFFRQPAHFEYLKTHIIPDLLKKNRIQKKIRILSACCSTGEEPYTLSMVLYSFLTYLANWDVKIYAGDISQNALSIARKGEYPLGSHTFCEMKEDDTKRYFQVNDKTATVKPEIKKLVEFYYTNILTDPLPDKFDIIFCRNALIYFCGEKRKAVLKKFFSNLNDDGHFFLGYSENLYGWEDRFKTIRLSGGFLYQKGSNSDHNARLSSKPTLQPIKTPKKITQSESNIFQVKEQSGNLFIHLTGKIDDEEEANSEKKLDVTMRYVATKTNRKVILDTSELTFINSNSVEILAKFARTLRGKNSDIVAFVPNQSIYSFFERAGLDIIFEIYQNLEEAIESIDEI